MQKSQHCHLSCLRQKEEKEEEEERKEENYQAQRSDVPILSKRKQNPSTRTVSILKCCTRVILPICIQFRRKLFRSVASTTPRSKFVRSLKQIQRRSCSDKESLRG
jgi:hypothetical protein